MAEERHIRSFGLAGGPICVLEHLDKLYVSTDEEPTIHVIDLETETESFGLKGHSGLVLCLAAIGDRIFSGSADQSIREWNIRDGEKRVLSSKESGHNGGVTALTSWSDRNEKYLISGGEDGLILAWNLTVIE